MRPAARIPRSVPLPRSQPNGRLRPQHIAWVKSLQICICCGAIGPVDPAHVRMSRADLPGKLAGIGYKPDDKFVLPVCARCHRIDQHHKYGEPEFWARLGIDPVDACLRLWAVTGNDEQGLRCIARARQAIALHHNQRKANTP